MAVLSTLAGWAVVLAAAAVFFYSLKQNPRAVPSKLIPKSIDSRQPKAAKKSRKDGSLSGDQETKASKKPQKKKSQASVKADREAPISTIPQSTKSTGRDEDDDNREFARQLASIKAGTIITSKGQTAAKQKSVKQSRAQEKPQVELSSDNAPSSATGGDADDDQSSLNSPELSATTIASPVTNGGVSDMLEESAPGPSVLKITGSSTPSIPKKAKQQTAFEPAETKKQRQNRKKNEAKKQQRQEDETERKAILEKQRRTAREAEGRAAKDGSSFMAAKAPAASAWTAASGNENESNGNNLSNVQLLDTYEPKIKGKDQAVTTIPAKALYSDSEVAGSDWQNHFSTLPSEEEQTRMALQESDNWKTVKTKDRRPKQAKVASNDTKQSSSDEQNDYGVPPVIAPTGTGQKWNTTRVHVEPTGSVVERQQELQDSEWEVS